MHYVARKPGPPLDAFVESLWSLSDAPRHVRERIVPSGTVELVFNLAEDEFRIYELVGTAERCRRFRGAIASGCYGRFFGIDTREHASVVGVHFKPGGAASLLGVPPGELVDAHADLDVLWGRPAAELRERLCAAANVPRRFDLLEEALLEHLQIGRPRRGAVRAALVHLDIHAMEVRDVAKTLDISQRRFIEIFTEDVGMTPKRYARIRRFQRALGLASGTRPLSWSQLALESGYFDQAHLSRDWLEFTGHPPAAYMALGRTPVKDNHLALPEAGVNSIQDASPSTP